MVDHPVKIIRASTADARLLSKLSKKTFEDTFTGTCTDSDMKSFIDNAFSEDAISTELKNDEDHYFIAYYNNIAAGYMRLKEDYSEYGAITKYNALELKRIYVLKEHQSKKVGAALMSYAVQFGSQKKYEVLWLGVWEHNEKAKLFYKKWGFIETGDTHDFPIGNTPQTDRWMIKFIDQR
jgi:ribosomal protein S18 acetylase RimI-like enzyme